MGQEDKKRSGEGSPEKETKKKGKLKVKVRDSNQKMVSGKKPNKEKLNTLGKLTKSNDKSSESNVTNVDKGIHNNNEWARNVSAINHTVDKTVVTRKTAAEKGIQITKQVANPNLINRNKTNKNNCTRLEVEEDDMDIEVHNFEDESCFPEEEDMVTETESDSSSDKSTSSSSSDDEVYRRR